MNLEAAARLWQRFLAGETLDPRDERQLLEALDHDSALRASLHADAKIHGLLGSVRPEPENRAFVAEVKRLLDAQDDGAAFVDRFRHRLEATLPRRAFPFRRLLLAAAVVLVAVLLWLVARPSRPGPEPSVPLAERRPPSSVPAKTPAPERAPDPRPAPIPAPVTPEKPPALPTKLPESPLPAPRQEELPPAPVPAPAPAPAPLPEPSVPPAPPPAGRTETVVAAVESVQGDVGVRHDGKRRAVAPGMALHRTESLETVGPTSSVVVRLPDQTRLELWGDSVLGKIDPPDLPERRIVLQKGSLRVEAAPQAAARSLVFETPEAEARVVGTEFLLATGVDGAGSTRLEVDEGKVKLTRRADQRSVEVLGGQFAVAAQAVEIRAQRQGDRRRAKNAAHPGVDVKKVDLAIDRGTRWLVQAAENEASIRMYGDIMLYALIHAGLPPEHPTIQKILKILLEREGFPDAGIYRASLQAMALGEIDPARFQERIARCGQFILDNQCEDGGWGYGKDTTFPVFSTAPLPAKDVATDARDQKAKGLTAARPKARIRLSPQRTGGGPSDTSNSQYAALGLRACMEAHVYPPLETLQKAKKYWETIRDPDGGWGYGISNPSYGSMTMGGLACLILYKHQLRENWAGDPAIAKGFAWIENHFSAKENPKAPGHQQDKLYYYLYATERLGIFSRRGAYGPHDWYREGANTLIALQKADGSWNGNPDGSFRESDTCFALLFLRRATAPLVDVPSVDRFIPVNPRK